MTVTNIITATNQPKKRLLIVGLALVITLIVAFGVYSAVFKSAPLSGIASPTNLLNNLKPTGAYWAVFLNNGQTYFGKLDPDNLNGNFITLSEVHYLEKAAETTTPAAKTAPQPEKSGYSLVRLGNELHGPLDTMIINRASVLFIEQLKPDSKVVTAITVAK